ncbi:MAG: acyl-CoA synthetase, partial [Mycobacteriaceae bacterium]|nr:acyl-CoA synthetase [Mycobacteriaceae bacterium]
MPEASVLSTLRERAGLQPEDVVFTYTDYDSDWDGAAEDVTWSQLYRRVQNLAHEVKAIGEAGDRAVILAPQGLDYIVAFLGSMLASRIAVPLSFPHPGTHDERVSAVLADTSPTVVLTTSSIAGTITEYVGPTGGGSAPTVLEVDALDLDARKGANARVEGLPELAYLQYTSGSTRVPAGVMITHTNLYSNFRQLMAAYFSQTGGVAPADMTLVSWLPFYHDMGLVLGVVAPILGGFRGDLTSPMAFLQRPARWVQALARDNHTWSAAPNFAFELASAKTTDEDMAGLDMGKVLGIIGGAERIHPATLKRFADRFAKYNFSEEAFKPSYGLAEATVYVASRTAGGPPEVVYFDPEKLSAGSALRCEPAVGSPLLSYGMPESPMIRIVDPDTRIESPAGEVGEIWVRGENVAEGYWHKPAETERTFGGMLAAGTPEGPWLRTGDLGFVSEGEMFIVGRMKDMLIVYGRNHYPEDIEATVQEISGGRVAAISVTVGATEKLVVLVEYKKRRNAPEDDAEAFAEFKNAVTSAISNEHALNVADLVLVAPGSLPTTTSGKIRRSSCGDMYHKQEFMDTIFLVVKLFKVFKAEGAVALEAHI